MRAEKGVNLQVRVGANTGEVVVRSIKTGAGHVEYPPIGHSTSLGSRLQAARLIKFASESEVSQYPGIASWKLAIANSGVVAIR